MRYLLTIVEQLDRAARELSIDHPINNRLALILIDNATELILHRQCMDLLERNAFTSSLQDQLQTVISDNSNALESGHQHLEEVAEHVLLPKQRERAKGRHFDGKIKVLKQVGDLTDAEGRFVTIAHDYRNEVYHVGLTHDHIIRAIAGRYFLLCCDLFARMGQRAYFSHSVSSTDTYTDTALRYLPKRGGRIDFSNVDRSTLAESLRDELPGEMPDLAKTLASSAHSAIWEIMDQFQFIVDNNYGTLNAMETLKHVQLTYDFAQAIEREDYKNFSVRIDPRGGVNKLVMTFDNNWKQEYTSVPDKRWTSRADAIERQGDPLVAMDWYQSLRRDMIYLEEAILAVSAELDRWIQMEIDEARGK